MTAVVDFIGEIVAKTSAKVKPNIGKDVFYQYGNLINIDNILVSYSQTAAFREKKYPAIFLIKKFTESKEKDPDIETEASLQLLIVMDTSVNYREADREEKVFKPILYPIYETFIKQLKKDSRVKLQKFGLLPHNKTDCSLISSEYQVQTARGTKNLFTDNLDAIYISNLKLTLLKTC